MFPIADYRQAERSARSQIHNWRMAEAHTVDTFIRIGFPVRIESPHEVGQLLDTMQEGRFEWFMREFDGLPDEDFELLTRSLVAAVQFQLQFLPLRGPVVPLSTMMSALSIFRKLRGFSPRVRRILEVGPGCGYLSFMLRQHCLLENYSQIEACESFYVLQSMINRFLFAGRFVEDVQRPEGRRLFSTMTENVDSPAEIDRAALGLPKCYHYPWWSLDRVLEKPEYFDVVTSNANLNEMSRAALRDYLAVFKSVLAPDGIFFVQCTGFEGHGTVDQLFDLLAASGFAAVFCAIAGDVTFQREGRRVTRYICLNNIVMVREGHPLYRQAEGRANFRSGHFMEAPWIVRMFFPAPGRHYTRGQVIDNVKRRLAEAAKVEWDSPTLPGSERAVGVNEAAAAGHG